MTLFHDFISLFFPRNCFTCLDILAKGERYICTNCINDLPKTNFHLDSNNPLHYRLANVNILRFAMAYVKFVKGGKIQKLLHKYKYENYPEIGELLGRWYGAELHKNNISRQLDIIIPVPLHKKKLKKRGYNQSDFFAAGLSVTMYLPWRNDILLRKKFSQTQTKKTRIERWQNVKDIFVVNVPREIDGKNILLVDDVITTGSTLEACAFVLEQNGAKSISVATIAFAE